VNGLTPHHEHFRHGSDIGIRGIGPTCASAFEQAALALTAVITPPQGIQLRQQITVDCTAPDLELLLVEWLDRLVVAMATRRLVFGSFAVTIRGIALHAEAFGEPVDPVRHAPAVEVKGATFTELRVAEVRSGEWLAQCVVDV
jgi:SHS2 domain-containing protein